MGYVFIVLGVILIGIGGFMIKNNNTNEGGKDEVVVYKSLSETHNAETVEGEAIDDSSADDITSREKGTKFEEYVVGLFDKTHFSICDWRGDKKSSDGRYAESNQYPDLELALQLNDSRHVFAVECKWRAAFNEDGKLKWSYDAQIKRYNEFASEKNIPVFVVIGVGGEPNSPSEIYCVPLSGLKYPYVAKDYLSRFSHGVGKNFFYDGKEKMLK